MGSAVRRAAAKATEWKTRLDVELKAAYEDDGESVEQLAADLGVTDEAMRQRLHALGVQLRGRGRPRKDD